MRSLVILVSVVIVLCVRMNSGIGVTNSDNESTLVKQMIAKVEQQNGMIENLVTRVEYLEKRDGDLKVENELLTMRVTQLERRERQLSLDSNLLRTQLRKQKRVTDTLSSQLAESKSENSRLTNTKGDNSLNQLLASNGNSSLQPSADNSTSGLTEEESDNQQDLRQNGIRTTGSSASIKEKAHGRIRRQVYVGEDIAFTAGISGSNHPYTGSLGQTVIFDYTITNNGNAYDRATGEFIAPVAGTYVFSVTLKTDSESESYYKFTKNGDEVTRMTIRGEIGRFLTTSKTLILELVQGDIIAIEDRVFSGQQLGAIMQSTFSGFMLHQPFHPGQISEVE